MKSFPHKLNEVYDQHYGNHSQPGSQELQDLFLAIVREFNSVFFVLDALDECKLDQRKELCEFFAGMVELSTGTSHGLLKLFVASRKELDIERAFERNSFPRVEVEAKKVDSDIELYVNAQINQCLDNKSLMLKDKILTALTTKANGMYVYFTMVNYLPFNNKYFLINIWSIGFFGLIFN